MVIGAVPIITISQIIVEIMTQNFIMLMMTAAHAEVEKYMSPLPIVGVMAVTGTLTTLNGVVRMMTMISLP